MTEQNSPPPQGQGVTQEGDVWYSQNGKTVPANLKFEYRGILHINDFGESYEQLVERVIQKFKNLDAGLTASGSPKSGTSPTPAAYGQGEYRDLKVMPKDLAKPDSDLKEEFRNDPVAQENVQLKQQLAAMQAQIDTISRGDADDEQVIASPAPVKSKRKGPPAKPCQHCGKEYPSVHLHERHCSEKPAAA